MRENATIFGTHAKIIAQLNVLLSAGMGPEPNRLDNFPRALLLGGLGSLLQRGHTSRH